MSGLYALVSALGGVEPTKIPLLIVGYGFGASFVALFAQLGGGIYTKAADVGADLVGKVEAGIPEDDPRNPAVIADLVGDNVGDCAGRGADLFESTAAENIGAMVLGLSLYTFWTEIAPAGMRWDEGAALAWIFFPLVARSFGIFASLVGVLVVRLRNEEKDPMSGINMGYYVTCALAAVFFYFATKIMFEDELGSGYLYFFGAGVIGDGHRHGLQRLARRKGQRSGLVEEVIVARVVLVRRGPALRPP